MYNKENNEVDNINVLAIVEAAPKTSCREIQEHVGVTKSRVQTILHKNKFKPYKSKIVHRLRPGDAERRMNFCRWYLENIQNDINFCRKIIWSDESYISSAGIFNRHNTRHWSQTNEFITFTREQQGRFGFSVSCFILGGRIKYEIFEERLSAARYLQILRNNLPDLLDEIPLGHLPEIYFQQDGAPAHNSHNVTQYLNDNFPDHWIGTRGPANWPPRSPDLSVLDFFLWGFIKNKIYSVRHETKNDLRVATQQAFTELQERPIIIINALNSIRKRCEMCITKNGNVFEQYLKHNVN